VIALIRYQIAILLRSHRWVGPLLGYTVFVTFVGAAGSQPLSQGLDWSAAMLLPVAGWLTRSALAAEPPAARTCTAAAGGPHRAQLAALAAAAAAGVVLALAGAAYEVATCHWPRGGIVAMLGAIAGGLAVAVVCLAIGSAAGALCSPPVIRGRGIGILSLIGVVIVALIAGISPANAALRQTGPEPHAAAWLTGLPVIVAVALAAASWSVSAVLAARRGG
jgi:hypothetical protein